MKDLNSMKMNELVKHYNNLGPKRPAGPKTFSSKAVAIARIRSLMDGKGSNAGVKKEKPVDDTENRAAFNVGSIAGKGKIGNMIVSYLVQTDIKLTHKDILDRVKAAHPNAKTSLGCISWYATKVRNAGVKLPRKTSV